jgi:hypothetical protein
MKSPERCRISFGKNTTLWQKHHASAKTPLAIHTTITLFNTLVGTNPSIHPKGIKYMYNVHRLAIKRSEKHPTSATLVSPHRF